jgi:hypothetical protein
VAYTALPELTTDHIDFDRWQTCPVRKGGCQEVIWRRERGYMDGRGLALSSMGGVYFGRFVEGRWCRRYLLRWSPHALRRSILGDGICED